MDILLEIKGLKKYFPVQSGKLLDRKVDYVKAVDDISFTIREGETLGIVGESGCGKSTTGRAAIRLIEPTEGEIYFRNKNLSQLSARELRETRRDLQIVFQDPYASLNPRKTVGGTLEEPLI
ncbi:MAG: ATP-binding cassette domain-containing protein, partial [Clostridia bacterium]|nr:ATP-binding cassette domain-containing protein [Clostridia bacterium]